MLLSGPGMRGIVARYRGGPFLGALEQAGHHAVGLVGHLAGQQLIKDQAHREDVGTLVEILAQGLLRRHVVHGADQGAGLGHAVAFEGAGQAEIHHQHPAGLVAHDVLRLQVAVNDACAVRGFERAAGLLHDLDRFLGSKFSLLLHQAAQVLTLDELHGDELHAVGLAQVVDPDDVLVGDLGGQKQFLLEAVNDGLVAGQIRADDFQRHHAIQFDVARLVDRAHPAFAQDLQDFVTLPQKLTRFQHRRIGLGSRLPRRGLSREGADALDHGGRIRRVEIRNIHHRRRI